MNVQSYLNRISYTGKTEPTYDNLAAIHAAHLYHVPFENLDIHLKRPIILDETLVFEKVVNNQRGGFCYELNWLFGALLRALGYQVTVLSSRSINDDGSLGIEHDHLTLKVTCPADSGAASTIPWLADVGWGDGQRWVQLGLTGGGAGLTLVAWFEAMPPGGLAGLVLSSDDVDGDVARLAAAGVTVLQQPVDAQGGRSAVVADPDGNTVHLHGSDT